LVAEFVSTNPQHVVEEVNVGGGLGVPYTVDDLHAVPIGEFAAKVRDAYGAACAAAGVEPPPRLGVEAGRSIAGPAGLTLYTIGSIKEVPGIRTYVAVDGGMSDNPRPVTYGARYEAFLPARAADARPAVVAVAGKHCEQGDILVRDARLPAGAAVDDILAVPVTGAYAYSMASNYNLLPRAAVVFVRDGEARVVVRRETLDDLLVRDDMSDMGN
jgi:diaminopimelate decarboxylase